MDFGRLTPGLFHRLVAVMQPDSRGGSKTHPPQVLGGPPFPKLATLLEFAMLAMFQDLMRHKVHANAALLKAIREHEAAARDAELRTLLHHVILANRFWFSLMRGEPLTRKRNRACPIRSKQSCNFIATRTRKNLHGSLAFRTKTSQEQSKRRSFPARRFQSNRRSCRYACTVTVIAHNAQADSGSLAAFHRPWISSCD